MTIDSLTNTATSAQIASACKVADLAKRGKRTDAAYVPVMRLSLIRFVLGNYSVTDADTYAIDCYLKTKKYNR